MWWTDGLTSLESINACFGSTFAQRNPAHYLDFRYKETEDAKLLCASENTFLSGDSKM